MTEPPRVLRHLLALFPRAHREAYAEEMWAVVRHRFARAGKGAVARAKVQVEVVVDLVATALGMWMTNGGAKAMGGMTGWGLDLRFVARTLRRSPGYALTAMVVLAGAVAVNTTVFAYMRGTLLAKPTYPGSDRLVVVWGSNPADGQLRDVISGPNFIDFRRETTTLEALAAFHGDDVILSGGSRPEVVDAFAVSVDFFDAVPVEAAMGRVFDERERYSGGEAAVLVSHAWWRDRMGGDPSAVGRSLPIGGVPHTVVGVLPEDFEFAAPMPFYLPLHDDELAADARSRIHYHLFGRTAPGVSAADVSEDLTAAMRRITDRTGTYGTWTVLAEPFHDASVLAVRPILWTATVAVTLVLLIALANLATLFRIRTLGRADELGVRLALGGGGARVARVLALEAGVLALGGAALGLLMATPLLARVRDMLPLWIKIPESAARVPVLRAVIDPGVAALAAALAVAGALLLVVPGVISAVRGGGAAWGGRRSVSTRATRWLVAAELALATVLCVGAGLTTRSAGAMLDTEVGLRDEGLLTFYVGDVWERPYAEQVAYFREVVDAVEAVPGVESAALIDYVPFQGEDDYQGFDFLDRAMQPTERVREEWRRVSLGLFETAGMRMLAGRTFEARDFEGAPRVAVVNESLARKHYPDGQAVGRFLDANQRYRNLEIVGVVADVMSNGPATPPPAIVYVPLQGEPRGTTGMYVRVSSGPPMALVDEVRAAVESVDPSQPVLGFAPMSDLVDSWVAIPRAVRALISSLAALALGLGGLGVFGVVAYTVRTRTAEMGVRLALGASPKRLAREVVGGAVPMVMLGVGVGLAFAWLAARAARAVLFGVGPLDPVSLAGAVIALVIAALLATWLPARRVARIDPTAAMRAP